MTKSIGALLAEMRGKPTRARFADACKAAIHFFGVRNKGSSHQVKKMPWAGAPRINLHPGGGGKAKPYQILQLLQAIERLLQESKP